MPPKATPLSSAMPGYYEVMADAWVVFPGGARTLLRAGGVIRAEQVGGEQGIANLLAQGATLKPYIPS